MTPERHKQVLDELKQIRESLQFANETLNGPICDTIWMMHRPETLFDAFDGVIAIMEADQLPDAGKVEGWQLVPVEPTEAMIEAGRHVKRKRLLASVKAIQSGEDPDVLMGKTAGDEYRAMLAAAQKEQT